MIILITQNSDRAKAQEAGVDDYISKPFDGAVLLARLNALFRRLQFEQAR